MATANETVVMTDDDLKAIEARADAATLDPWLPGAITTSEFIEAARTDIPALAKEVRRLRQENADLLSNPCAAPLGRSDPNCGWPLCGCSLYANQVIAALQQKGIIGPLEIALGALADIANMTEGEIAGGVAQRKAKRIYHVIRGSNPSS